MHLKVNRNKGEQTIIGMLLAGTAIYVAIMIIGMVVATVLTANEKLGEDQLWIAIAAIHFISSLCGMLYLGITVSRGLLPVCVIQLLVYIAALLANTALFFGGQYGFVGRGVLLISAGGVCGVLASFFGKKGKKVKVSKNAYR